MIKLLKEIVRATEKQYEDNPGTGESYECVRRSIEKHNTTISEIDILPEQELTRLDAKKIILQIIFDLRYSQFTWQYIDDDMNSSYDSMYLSMIYSLIRNNKKEEFDIVSAMPLTTKEYMELQKEYGLI